MSDSDRSGEANAAENSLRRNWTEDFYVLTFLALSAILAVPLVVWSVCRGRLPGALELTDYFLWLAFIPPFVTLIWLGLGMVVVVRFCRAVEANRRRT